MEIKTKPHISVVVPVYKGEKMLQELVDSIVEVANRRL